MTMTMTMTVTMTAIEHFITFSPIPICAFSPPHHMIIWCWNKPEIKQETYELSQKRRRKKAKRTFLWLCLFLIFLERPRWWYHHKSCCSINSSDPNYTGCLFCHRFFWQRFVQFFLTEDMFLAKRWADSYSPEGLHFYELNFVFAARSSFIFLL